MTGAFRVHMYLILDSCKLLSKIRTQIQDINYVLMCEHSRMMSHWKKFTGWGQIMQSINPTSLIIK